MMQERLDRILLSIACDKREPAVIRMGWDECRDLVAEVQYFSAGPLGTTTWYRGVPIEKSDHLNGRVWIETRDGVIYTEEGAADIGRCRPTFYNHHLKMKEIATLYDAFQAGMIDEQTFVRVSRKLLEDELNEQKEQQQDKQAGPV